MQVLHNRQPQPASSICQCKADDPLSVDHEPVLHLYQQTQIEMREHHQSALVLQQERNLAQAILQSIRVLVVVSDPSGRIVQFNQTCQQITGYTLDEVVGQRIWDVLIAPEDVGAAQQFWATALVDHTLGAVEQVWVTKAGEQRLISFTLSTLEDTDGHIEYLIGTGADVTEARRAEAALRKSEATNRALLDVIPDLMIRIREDGTYLDFLPTRNFKVIQPFQEMRGQSIYDVMPRPAAEERMAYIRRALETQTTQVYEYQLEIEGETFYEEARIAVSGEGEALAIIRDISERKHAEIQQQQTEAVLHSLVKGTASVTGENFFEALVQHIAQTLNIRHALVTSCHGHQVRTMAFYSDGQLQPNISYELCQIPYEMPSDQPFYGCSHNCLQDINGLTQYLSDERLTCLEAESYFGLVLMNTQGSPIGTLCILDSQPIDHHSQVASILKIFATRAAAELERQQTIEALHHLNQELEARVNARTQELSRINTALMNSNIALLESQEQLRLSEELLRLTIDNAPIGIVTCSLEGQFQTVNQAFCSMLGYTPDEILRQTVSTITHPDDQEASRCTIQYLVTGQGNTAELEKRYLHKDGSAVDVIVRIGTMRDELGCPLQLVAEIEDIRDRKRSEAERNRLLNILEASLNEIYIFDAETLTLSYANSSALHNLGYSLEQLCQLTVIDLNLDLAKADFQALIAPLNHHETDKINFETVHQRADGSCYPVDVRLQLIELETERIFLAVVLDISDRKQADQQINRQLLAIESSIDGIAILREGVYEYLNQAHVSLFGYESMEELLGKPWQVFYSPTEQERIQNEVFPILGSRGHWRGEAIATCKDGSSFYEEVSLTLSSNGDLICVCRDITERKRAEADIRKALEAERELNDLKSRFVSMTSHEFRTPLGVIASSAGIIQDYGDRLDEAKTHKHLQRIQDSVIHMTQLLEDVLMLSRLEAGKLRLKLMPTSIDIFCQDIIEEVNLSDGSSRIVCQIQAMPTEPVLIDQRLLRQILNNLLSNALKYSLPETTVYLQVAYQANCFMLTIRDQGIGIPSEDLKHLFQSFHRAKNVGNIPGTGLGLSIVKKLVELHQGNITCTSQVNVGTTFTVSLPHF